jgi:hypothetical protein
MNGVSLATFETPLSSGFMIVSNQRSPVYSQLYRTAGSHSVVNARFLIAPLFGSGVDDTTGSMPLSLIAAAAAGEARKAMSAPAVSGSLAPTTTPAENTVIF